MRSSALYPFSLYSHYPPTLAISKDEEDAIRDFFRPDSPYPRIPRTPLISYVARVVAKTHSKILRTTVTTSYGLNKACQLTLTRVPGPDKDDEITYRDYSCRPFPSRSEDGCEKENSGFCAAWTGAGYVDYLATGFTAITPLVILFGISTHSRRRRIWRALAGMTMLQSLTGVIAFAMITDMYTRNQYSGFEHADLGKAYILHTLAWTLSFLVSVGIALTGYAAEKGQAWATGPRGYYPIVG
ncbi:hypothetical protein MD484_g3629, partial [Candolleomyces efflorescens]